MKTQNINLKKPEPLMELSRNSSLSGRSSSPNLYRSSMNRSQLYLTESSPYNNPKNAVNIKRNLRAESICIKPKSKQKNIGYGNINKLQKVTVKSKQIPHYAMDTFSAFIRNSNKLV